MASLILALTCTFAMPSAHADGAEPVIDTVVGTGDPGNAGDGGPALDATLDRPQSLATTRDGTLYVVSGRSVRAVDADGTMRTVYTSKATGDDGLGQVAVRRDGTVYVADTDGNRVYAVSPKGSVEVVAGTGKRGSYDERNGDGGPATKARLSAPHGLAVATDGTLYVTDGTTYQVRAISPDGRIGSIADADHRSSLALSGRTLYVSRPEDDVVVAVDLDDHTSRDVADHATSGLHGSTSFDHPTDLAVGPDGRLYIACTYESGSDAEYTLVYALDPAKRGLELIAGGAARSGLGDGGPAVGATIGGPNHTEAMGVAVGGDGTVYVADAANHRVRAVREGTVGGNKPYNGQSRETVDTVVGGAGAPEDEKVDDGPRPRRDVHLNLPGDVAVDRDGTVYVADTGNGRVRAVDPEDGTVRTVAGRSPDPDEIDDAPGDGGEATDALLNRPLALALGPGHVLYVAEAGPDGRVRVVDLDEDTIDSVPGTTGDRAGPVDVAVGRDGELYVAYLNDNRVYRVDPVDRTRKLLAGRPKGDAPDVENHDLLAPSALAVDRDGAVLVADAGANRVARIDPKTSKVSTVAGVYHQGIGLFAEPRQPYATGDGGQARSADLGIVSGIEVGQNGQLYLTDAANHRVRVVDRVTGVIQTVAGTGGYRPIDPSDVTGDGHVAGDGGAYGGDGGQAGRAKLDQPQSVTVAPDGVLYVADAGNDRVRAIGSFDLPEGRDAGTLPLSAALALGSVLVAALLSPRQRDSLARIR